MSLAQGFLERGLEVDLVLCRVRGPLLAEVPSAVRLVPLRPAPTMLGRLLVVAADPGGTPELARPVLLSWRPPSSYRMLPSLTRYLRRERPAALISAFPFENLLAIAAKRLGRRQDQGHRHRAQHHHALDPPGGEVEASLSARTGPAPVPDGGRDRRGLRGRGRRARPAYRPAARADRHHPQCRGERVGAGQGRRSGAAPVVRPGRATGGPRCRSPHRAEGLPDACSGRSRACDRHDRPGW